MAYRRFRGPKGWIKRGFKRRAKKVKRVVRRVARACHGRHRRQY